MDFNEIRKSFKSDCTKCCGLCCVSLYFSKIDGFCEDKPAKKPCKNLDDNFQCKVHSSLKEMNLTGCLSFDCLGAGQWITQKMKTNYIHDSLILDHFVNVLHLQHTLFYISEVVEMCRDEKALNLLHKGLIVRDSLNDYEPFIIEANGFLKHYVKINYSKDLDYSMKFLIKKDFRNTNLHQACFLGADLRDADIRNSDLSASHFLTQAQINSCIGNEKTKLPKLLNKPTHWLKGEPNEQ